MTKNVRLFENGSFTANIILENTARNVVLGGECAEVCIVMPGFKDKVYGDYKILLVPQNFKHECTAGKVFTYGMAMNSTVTLSSVGEEKCVMTVQNEICNIWGKVI